MDRSERSGPLNSVVCDKISESVVSVYTFGPVKNPLPLIFRKHVEVFLGLWLFFQQLGKVTVFQITHLAGSMPAKAENNRSIPDLCTGDFCIE